MAVGVVKKGGDVAWRVAVDWSAVVDLGEGVSGLILGVSVAVGLDVDNGTASGVSAWVGGVSSWVQPSRMMMRRATIVQIIICGLIRWSCLICFSKLCGDLKIALRGKSPGNGFSWLYHSPG
jgi:hypothetical protein